MRSQNGSKCPPLQCVLHMALYCFFTVVYPCAVYLLLFILVLFIYCCLSLCCLFTVVYPCAVFTVYLCVVFSFVLTLISSCVFSVIYLS